MKTREDNMALGTLLLGIGFVLLLVWLLKVVLATFLSLAESVLTIGFYVVLIYAAIALVLTVYAHLFPNKTPKLIKVALGFHHTVAVSVKLLFRGIKTLFFKKKKTKIQQ